MEKVNASDDRAKSISEFNSYLGSLVTYVLKTTHWNQAAEILNSVLPMIGNYINLSNLHLPKELSDNPKQEPNVESSDWNLWRKLDSREYVTLIPMQKGTNRESKKKREKEQLEGLPCNGNCLCENASDGCMNRLAEAKRKARKAIDVTMQLNKKKIAKQKNIIETEAIDYSKFEKECFSIANQCGDGR